MASGCRGAAAGVAILSGGVAFLGAMPAQGVEILQNGGFEMNDGFNGDNVGFSWDNDAGPPNFDVYSHATQVYYEGAAPAGAGDWYFHVVGVAGVPTQTADITTAFAASAIDQGTLQIDFSGYLAGFTAQQDHGVLELAFLDGNGTQLGGIASRLDGGAPLAGDGQSIVFDDPDDFVEFADASFSPTVVANFPANPTAAWKLYRDFVGVPVGARSAVVSIPGTGNDNYIDLVSLDVIDSGQEQFLRLEVNKSSGAISVVNGTTESLDIEYYEITSTAGELSAGWNSFQDQMLDSLGPDPEDNWIEGDVDANLLTEAFLGASTFSVAETQTLANAYGGGSGGAEDLQFSYGLATGELLRGIVTYVTSAALDGDYNNDGKVDAIDYAVWREALGTATTLPNDTTPGTVTSADYTVWKTNFGNPSPGAGAVATPEPASAIILLCGSGLFASLIRRRD